MTYDCQTCGACCCNSDQNKAEKFIDYVEVLKRDKLRKHERLLHKLTVPNDKGERHMILRGREQRCIALEGKLGESVSCTIYELRPSACRKVEAGSKECRDRRRERGIKAAVR